MMGRIGCGVESRVWGWWNENWISDLIQKKKKGDHWWDCKER